ncbi:hypothetical protein Taro_051206 [Colocasia esculenta]|uniref:Uncharacterized protein n=1 Tax=Colocasia esculenta TaxID=4460 RepID=A0A843XFC7_COLES|nr:hypothetical protein [Colocasia esculenta]
MRQGGRESRDAHALEPGSGAAPSSVMALTHHFRQQFLCTPILQRMPFLPRSAQKLVQARKAVGRKLTVRGCQGEQKRVRRSFLSLEEAGLVEVSGLSSHEKFLCRLTGEMRTKMKCRKSHALSQYSVTSHAFSKPKKPSLKLVTVRQNLLKLGHNFIYITVFRTSEVEVKVTEVEVVEVEVEVEVEVAEVEKLKSKLELKSKLKLLKLKLKLKSQLLKSKLKTKLKSK